MRRSRIRKSALPTINSASSVRAKSFARRRNGRRSSARRAGAFDEMDLADLFAGLTGRRGRPGRRGPAPAMRGQDYEITAPITLEDAFHGTHLNLDLTTTEFDEQGTPRRVPRIIKARIPKGATEGQSLRLPGQGGKGINGGPAGDIYLNITLRPHRLYRASGHDLFLDLPLTPWEAALGASVRGAHARRAGKLARTARHAYRPAIAPVRARPAQAAEAAPAIFTRSPRWSCRLNYRSANAVF